MAMNSKNYDVKLTNVRCSFPHFFKKHASVEGGKEKYRGAFLINPNTSEGKTNLKNIRAAIKLAEFEVFGKSPMTYKNPDRCFLSDGNDNKKNGEDTARPGYEGMMVVNASNDNKFAVVDKNPSIPLSADDCRPYAGCYVNVFIRIWATKDQKLGGNGIFAGLETVQFFKDGDPFGAPPVDPTKVFDNVEDEDTEEDSTDTSDTGGDDDDGLDDL